MNSVSKLALGLAFLAASATISADEQKVIKKSEETTVQQASQNEIAPAEEKKSETTITEAIAFMAIAAATYAAWQYYACPQIDQVQPNWAKNWATDMGKMFIAVAIMDDLKDTFKTVKTKTVKLVKGATKVAKRAYAEVAC